ncbi:MAG: hypothetical protein IKJ05_00250 [Oscillospiraceae bacterium]|nr:hypothetical protein [Oscillospiraceae bacterium]
MDILERFLQNNNLRDSDDMDALLELADLTRQLVKEKRYDVIARVINFAIDKGYYEALTWVMDILQEELEKDDCALENFSCSLGRKIANYDGFVQTMQVDFNPFKNEMEKVYDTNGEVESFFNIIIYRTRFDNIYLVSSENFDTRDNDYIQYRLSFTQNIIK